MGPSKWREISVSSVRAGVNSVFLAITCTKQHCCPHFPSLMVLGGISEKEKKSLREAISNAATHGTKELHLGPQGVLRQTRTWIDDK